MCKDIGSQEKGDRITWTWMIQASTLASGSQLSSGDMDNPVLQDVIRQYNIHLTKLQYWNIALNIQIFKVKLQSSLQCLRNIYATKIYTWKLESCSLRLIARFYRRPEQTLDKTFTSSLVEHEQRARLHTVSRVPSILWHRPDTVVCLYQAKQIPRSASSTPKTNQCGRVHSKFFNRHPKTTQIPNWYASK